MPGQPLAVADTTVGIVLLGSGLVAWRLRPRSRTGLVMAATGLCWFAGSVVGAALLLHRGPLVQLLLSYPTGRLRRPLALAVVVVAWCTSAVLLLARNNWLTVGLAALVAVAALDLFVSSSGPTRKAGGPTLGSALLAGALALSSASRLLEWDADVAVLLVYDATVVLVTVILLADLLWGGWTDAALADLVTGLGQRAGTEGLGGQLRRAFGDPSLVVGFWTPDQNRYVDDLGQPVEVPAEGGHRAVTRIDDRGEPLAVLVHDPVVLDDPRLVSGVTAAARLAVANARMRAAVRVRVEELAVSRRRLVEAGDEAGRLLQRELEHGAERRLGQVDLLLTDLQAGPIGGAGAELTAVRGELTGARVELREFAQGIRPTALDGGGLPGALPQLAARSSVPVTLAIDVGRLAPPVEAAVFFVCSEALANIAKHSQATQASVEIRFDDGDVVATVTDDGVGGADARGSGLRGLADRVEALGGMLTVAADGAGGTRLTARIRSTGAQIEESR